MLELYAAGKIDASDMITHGEHLHDLLRSVLICLPDFKFNEIEKAYDVFSRAADTKSLKVNIEF